MSTAPCPTCAAVAPAWFVCRDYNRRIDAQDFPYFRCSSCQTLFLHPLPPDLGRYYPADYYTIPRDREQLAREAHVDLPKLEVLRAFGPPGRLLEIGPAFGYFAHLAQTAGWTVEAIEMDAACSAFLRRTLGIRVENSADTVGALRTLEPFDVIALWHVIEHLPRPWETIQAAAERLRPGGVLMLAAPNPDAFQFGVLGRRWCHVDAPRHVQLIPMKLLRERTAALGLEQIHATTTDPAAKFWDRFGWQMSLGNLGRGRVLRKGLRILGGLVAWTMIPLDRRPGRGSAYTMVFRKGKSR